MSVEKPVRRSMFPKPVIGIVGGVGAGKSAVAEAFGGLGCAVIDSDKVAHGVLNREDVRRQLRAWWGDGVFDAEGRPNRKAIGGIVFRDAAERTRLEGLVHPLVEEARKRRMAELREDPAVRGVVWDTPLLLEVGMDQLCDAVVFVKVPYEKRLERVRRSRSWTSEELAKREKSQFALDKKEILADYIVDNSGEVDTLLRQVRDVFSQILARKSAPA